MAQKAAKMQGKLPKKGQHDLFRPMLEDIIDRSHELVLLEKHIDWEYFEKDFELFWRAVNQERSDSNKIYSLHKPFTKCIAKGKAHKQYEFGNKAGLISTGKAGMKIITAIQVFY